MIREKVTFGDISILTRQKAARIVQTAGKFSSQIMLEQGSKIVNGKSTLGLLSLNADDTGSIYIIVTGSDEQQAYEAVKAEMAK